jgi:hypothetical protein
MQTCGLGSPATELLGWKPEAAQLVGRGEKSCTGAKDIRERCCEYLVQRASNARGGGLIAAVDAVLRAVPEIAP